MFLMFALIFVLCLSGSAAHASLERRHASLHDHEPSELQADQLVTVPVNSKLAVTARASSDAGPRRSQPENTHARSTLVRKEHSAIDDVDSLGGVAKIMVEWSGASSHSRVLASAAQNASNAESGLLAEAAADSSNIPNVKVIRNKGCTSKKRCCAAPIAAPTGAECASMDKDRPYINEGASCTVTCRGLCEMPEPSMLMCKCKKDNECGFEMIPITCTFSQMYAGAMGILVLGCCGFCVWAANQPEQPERHDPNDRFNNDDSTVVVNYDDDAGLTGMEHRQGY